MGVAHTIPEKFFDERRLNDHEGFRDPDEIWASLNDAGKLERFQLPESRLLFRGQTDAGWGLNSTLYRVARSRLRELHGTSAKVKARAESGLIDVEESVVQLARQNGLGRNMSDLQLLGLLQHHGSPTRLIDVSEDPLVGLYFAVEGQDDRDSRFFILTGGRDPLDDREKDQLPWLDWVRQGNTRRPEWSQRVWLVDASAQDARMVSQSGKFLLGGLYSPGGDLPQYWKESRASIPVSELREITTLAINFPARELAARDGNRWSAYGWTIRIEAAWKEPLRELLAQAGLTRDSIYPPVDEVRRLLLYMSAQLAETSI